ncbi:MAG: hypothetical protein ABR597_03135 [Bacteroidales bacterium]
MKNWLKFTMVLAIGAFIFTACETDVTLTVPTTDVTIDLGDEFDPMDGVTVDGADIGDVQVLWNPAWSNVLVDYYVASYSVEGQTAQRDVYVQADKLAKTYQVSDEDNDGTQYNPYPVTVTRGPEFNELRFNELYFDNVIVNGVVNGSVLTIPQQTLEGVSIEGTGTYDGVAQKILTIDYIIDGVPGTSTFE